MKKLFVICMICVCMLSSLTSCVSSDFTGKTDPVDEGTDSTNTPELTPEDILSQLGPIDDKGWTPEVEDETAGIGGTQASNDEDFLSSTNDESSNSTGTSDSSNSSNETTVQEPESNVTKEPILAEVLRSSDTLVANKVTQIAVVPSPAPWSLPNLQGGYIDGQYFYQAFLKIYTENQTENTVVIVKYDLKQKKVIAQSEVMYLNHANDITFNSKRGCLVVCHNAPNYKLITYINPETLSVIETVKLSHNIYAIDYNPTYDRYVIGISGGYTFRILDGNLNPVSKIYQGTEKVSGYTKQNVCCDDNYIYFLYHNSSSIAVFDWDGNFVTYIEFTVVGEPENVSVVDGTIYVVTGKNQNAYVYTIEGLEPKK